MLCGRIKLAFFLKSKLCPFLTIYRLIIDQLIRKITGRLRDYENLKMCRICLCETPSNRPSVNKTGNGFIYFIYKLCSTYMGESDTPFSLSTFFSFFPTKAAFSITKIKNYYMANCKNFLVSPSYFPPCAAAKVSRINLSH